MNSSEQRDANAVHTFSWSDARGNAYSLSTDLTALAEAQWNAIQALPKRGGALESAAAELQSAYASGDLVALQEATHTVSKAAPYLPVPLVSCNCDGVIRSQMAQCNH